MNEQTQNQTTAVATEKPVPRKSNHIFHANCIELRELLEKVDITTATVIRNKRPALLITELEQNMLKVFAETDYNVKKTSELLKVSHTNVWQRLYGDNKKSIGMLGKLRKYVAGEYELPAAETEATAV